jgi:glycosyltransferase involved in cell wall biosynthesis
MKVSIVTVTLNAVGTIAATLESVAAQTYKEVEHIVVDGASKDGTPELVMRVGRRVSLMISEPDNGIYDALNKGLRLVTGDIVGFLHADDIYADCRILERVAEFFTVSDELDALFGDVEFISATKPGRPLRRYRSSHFRPERLAWGWMPAHPALFIRRRIYERYGLFRTDYRIAGDFEFVARIFRGKTLRYHYLPEVLVRMGTGGISTGGWRSTILLNREVLRACRENGIKTNALKILSKYPAKLFEFVIK